jgi:hypothetical protein
MPRYSGRELPSGLKSLLFPSWSSYIIYRSVCMVHAHLESADDMVRMQRRICSAELDANMTISMRRVDHTDSESS